MAGTGNTANLKPASSSIVSSHPRSAPTESSIRSALAPSILNSEPRVIFIVFATKAVPAARQTLPCSSGNSSAYAVNQSMTLAPALPFMFASVGSMGMRHIGKRGS